MNTEQIHKLQMIGFLVFHPFSFALIFIQSIDSFIHNFHFTKYHYHYYIVTVFGACMRMIWCDICLFSLSILSIVNFNISFFFSFGFSFCRCAILMWYCIVLFQSVALCATMIFFTEWKVEVVLIFADPVNALNRMNKIEWIALVRLFDWIIIIIFSLSSSIEAMMTFDLTFTKWSKGIQVYFLQHKKFEYFHMGCA